MSAEADRTCKRCSVARVNALIEAYHQAHQQGDQARLGRLRKIISICEGRGFAGGSQLLVAGLGEKELRALCWNVSSFLEDSEVEINLGLKL